MTDHLRHWDVLKKTDPAHTKKFDRTGGFKGTAIKPIYQIQRLTDHFGPVGIGWGITEPHFQVERFGEEVLVFCTIGLWYKDSDQISQPVYGTGGDNLRLKRGERQLPNDEAFKAAQTDALSNAMKLLGLAADVHMGLHDDDKYIRELKRELAEDNGAAIPQAARPVVAPKAGPAPGNGIETGAFKIRGLSKDAGAAGWATACDALLRKAKSTDELDAIMRDNDEALKKLADSHADLKADLWRTYAEMSEKLGAQTVLSAA